MDLDGFVLKKVSCYAGDPLCAVACKCHKGFYGDSCRMTSSERDKRSSAREMAAANIAALVRSEDPTSDVVESWASSLAATSSKYDELSENCTDVIQGVSEAILREAGEAGVGYESLSPVLDALDSASKAKALINAQKMQGRNASMRPSISNRVQAFRVTAPSLFDRPGTISGFRGRTASGKFRVGYNGVFRDVDCDADAAAVHAALLQILPTAVAKNASDVEVTRSHGAYALRGGVSLLRGTRGATCTNSRLDPCVFSTLPVGDLVRVDRVWYRVAHSYFSSSTFLDLASEFNLQKSILPFLQEGVRNRTLYRWSHGYEWRALFKSPSVLQDPSLVKP